MHNCQGRAASQAVYSRFAAAVSPPGISDVAIATASLALHECRRPPRPLLADIEETSDLAYSVQPRGDLFLTVSLTGVKIQCQTLGIQEGF